MAVAAKGTLVAGVVAAETVAAVALCIMGTFRRGTMEAMNRRVQHYGKRSGIFGMVNIKSGKPSSWVKPADGMQSQCKARKRGGEIKNKKRENSLLQVQLKEGCQHDRRFPEKRARTTANAGVISKNRSLPKQPVTWELVHNFFSSPQYCCKALQNKSLLTVTYSLLNWGRKMVTVYFNF